MGGVGVLPYLLIQHTTVCMYMYMYKVCTFTWYTRYTRIKYDLSWQMN